MGENPRALVNMVGREFMRFNIDFCSFGQCYKLNQVHWFAWPVSYGEEKVQEEIPWKGIPRKSLHNSLRPLKNTLKTTTKSLEWGKETYIQHQSRKKHHPKKNLRRKRNSKTRKLYKIFCTYISTPNCSMIISFLSKSTYNSDALPLRRRKSKDTQILVVGSSS